MTRCCNVNTTKYEMRTSDPRTKIDYLLPSTRAIASKVVPGHAQSVHDHKLVGMSSETILFTQESVDASGGSKKGGVSGEAKLEARRKRPPKRPIDQTRARHVSSRSHLVLLFVRPPCVSQQPMDFLIDDGLLSIGTTDRIGPPTTGPGEQIVMLFDGTDTVCLGGSSRLPRSHVTGGVLCRLFFSSTAVRLTITSDGGT